MKGLLIISFFTFFITFTAQAQDYKDPIPQSAQTDEMRLLLKIMENKESIETNPSEGVTTFTLLKPGEIKVKRGSGQFFDVKAVTYKQVETDYKGRQVTYIFELTNKKTQAVSLRPRDRYTEVTLFLNDGDCLQKIPAYVIKDKGDASEFTRIEIKF